MEQPVYLRIKVKFDKPGVHGVKTFYLPYKRHTDLLLTLENVLKKPYVQEWFKGCRVIFVDCMGDVDLLIEDFANA